MPIKYILKSKDDDTPWNLINSSPVVKKAQLVKYIQDGLSLEDACKLACISNHQLGQYRNDPEFDDYIITSQSVCEYKQLRNINDAGDSGMWQASAWLLERLRPDKYGKKDTIVHEYDIKLNTFKTLVVNVINTFDPQIRKAFIQKLRTANVQQEVYDSANTVELLNDENKNVFSFTKEK